MATRTINLYPSGDISLNHSVSTGDAGWNMISDVTDDSGTTNIYHTLSTSTTTKTSQFNCSANTDEKPTGKIKVKSVKVSTYWLLNTANGTASSIQSRTATCTPSVSFENENYIDGTSSTRTSDDNENYYNFESSFSNLPIINKVFNTVDDLNAKLQIYTSGSFTSN